MYDYLAPERQLKDSFEIFQPSLPPRPVTRWRV